MTALIASSILVAVDFSGASAAAVDAAAELATALGARLHALHVTHVDVPPYFTRSQIAALEAEREKVLENARSHLADYLRSRGAPADVALQVLDGSPSEILPALVDHDLLVVGTHGRRGPRRWWLGSVAEQVAESSARPVLVVHPELAGPLRGRGPITLVASAEVSTSLAGAWATTLAAALGTEMTQVALPGIDFAPLARSAMVVVDRAAIGAADLEPAWFVRRCRVPVLLA